MTREEESAARDAAYRDCAARGLTTGETARAVGVSPPAVRQWARRTGVSFSPPARSRNTALYRDCAARGLTKAETAREVGVSVSRVSHFARLHPEVVFRAHFTPKPKKTAKRLGAKGIPEDKLADFDTLIRAGFSTAEARATVMRKKVKVPLMVPREQRVEA